jgi:hypothetical protein
MSEGPSNSNALLEVADCTAFTAHESSSLPPATKAAKAYDGSMAQVGLHKDRRKAKKRAAERAKSQACRDASIAFRMNARIADRHVQSAAMVTALGSLNNLKGNAAAGAFVGRVSRKPRPNRPWTLDEVKRQNLKVIRWDGR